MSTILDQIIAHKREEVAARRAARPYTELEAALATAAHPPRSLAAALQAPGSSGIIAEFKRRSPSQRDINLRVDVAEVTQGYVAAGAAALSVLTDERFFGGSDDDLRHARAGVDVPIIRKDFIVDEYQILEARLLGADAVLLIAACLTAAEIARLAAFAQGLGLEVLLELHGEEEVAKIPAGIDLVGVNNRNLKDFQVSIEHSLAIFDQLPATAVKVSESGIEDPEVILALRRRGYRGFLIGTYFMRAEAPARQCAAFIRRVAELDQLTDGAIAHR